MGTNYIAPTWRQPENLNKDRLSNYNIEFDGSRIQIPFTELSGSTNCTISFWAKIDYSANAEAKTPFHLTSGTNNPILWIFPASGTALDVYIGNVNFRLSGSFNKDIAEWNHWVLRFDGSETSINRTRVYQNGQQLTSQAGWGTATSIPSATNLILAGRNLNATQWYYQMPGNMSQCCIFDYTLSEDQINYLYNLNNPMAISGAEPIAYWPLGDNSNPTATAGYPNIVSAADSVFDFATSNEEIDAPGPYADGTQGDLTISAWVKQDSITSSYRPFICTGFTTSMTQPQIAMALRNVGGNRLYLFYNGGGGSNYIYAQNVMTQANRWYHCAFVRSGSTGKLYVDGQEVSTLNSADFSTDPAVTTADSEITLGGWRYSGSNESLNGELSNVCLWKTALTDGVGGQIEELYNNGLPLLELPEIPQNNNLLAWYKLNQSAVLIPGTPTNWTITKIGSPAYASGDDGGWAQNGILKSQDTNSYTIASGDYFQWNSPTIYTSGSDIVLSSSGGNAAGGGVGVEVIYQYNIDDSSWVTWHQHSDTSYGGGAYTVPSTSNLTVSNNIKIRVQLAGGPSNASEVTVLDINVNGGTSNYNETFNNTTRYGFWNNQDTQPPATSSADKWDIPDNRSAFPQSFDFDGSDDRISIPEFTFSGEFTLSMWVNPKAITGTNTFILGRWDGNFDNDINVKNEADGSSTIKLRIGGTTLTFYGYLTNPDGVIPLNTWSNVVLTRDSSNLITCYVDSVQFSTSTFTNTNTLTLDSIGRVINNSYGWEGFLSNIQFWDSALPATGTDSVETLYNNGVPLPTASVEPSSLKLWTRLDSSSKWNTITSQWNIPINPTTPIPWSKSAIAKSSANSFINNPTTSGIDLTNPTTTSFWFKSKTTQTNFAINAGSLGGGGDLAVIGERILIYRGSNNYRYFLVNTTTINDNNWHNLIFYVPGYANADIASSRMFMDGIELDVQTTISSGNPAAINNNPILGAGNIYLDIDEASFSNAVIWSSDQTANVTEIYNNGTPASSYTDSPILWWKLNNLTSGLDDLSGNGNNAIPSGPVFAVVEEDIIAYQLGVSDGMTEANLIEENVSVVNAESDTLPASALVQSDLTRKLPFSNYSVLFNGVDESFNCGPGFQYTDITVSCWIKLNTWGQYDRIYQTGISGGGIGFLLVLDDSLGGNKINAIWGNPTEESVTSSIDITTDTWYHILWTRNASEIKMYIDGADVSGGSTVSWGYGTGNDLELGRKPGGGNNFDGDLSNMAIWNSVLTQEEILDVYNNGVPTNLNTSFTPGQPEYWWPMDEDHTYFNGSVLIARDAVGSTDATGANVIQENIVGNAPGSTANGIGTNLTIADLKGDMQNSTNNSYSINMADYADGVTNPADSGRSTNVP